MVMPIHDHWLAPGPMMERAEVSDSPALLQELLHHAEGNPVAMGNLFSGALLMVVRSHDPFPQVQR